MSLAACLFRPVSHSRTSWVRLGPWQAVPFSLQADKNRPRAVGFSSISRLQSSATMEKVFTEKAAAPLGPYSQAVVANGTIYVSGQIPCNERGELVEGSVTDKTRACCLAVKNIVEAAGSSMDKVVRATVWLVDMKDFAEVNKEYEKHFISKPARTCVAVSQLPKGVNIEIEAIALK